MSTATKVVTRPPKECSHGYTNWRYCGSCTANVADGLMEDSKLWEKREAEYIAEIRDLKARLRAIAKAPFGHVITSKAQSEAWDLAERAINLRLKNWRKARE